MLKNFLRRMLSRLPYSRGADKLYHLAYFLYAHRRFPSRNSWLFNDHLYFLKTSTDLHTGLRQLTSDKLLMKHWVTKRLGESFVPKTLAVMRRNELQPDRFPRHCVAKPTHLCGLVVFVEDGVSVADCELLRASLSKNLYAISREANYRELEPRIICEESVAGANEIVDYKVHCYAGEPRIIQVDIDRHSHHVRSLYTPEWRKIEVTYSKPLGPAVPRPAMLDEMLSIARELSREFESVRVDLYSRPDQVFVGELTHCSEQAHGRFGSLDEERLFSRLYFGREE